MDNLNNEVLKHRKKKQSSISKSNTKSKHKHEYKSCLLICDNHPRLATVCNVCGKIGNLHSFETELYRDGMWRILEDEEVFEKYKNLENIVIEDIWQKYIPIEREYKNR